MPLTFEEANELLVYSAADGALFWRLTGKTAGGLTEKGYRKVHIKGKKYLAHRLVWLLINKKWPVGEIDHRNGIRNDNYISNLRDVTHQLNSFNTKPLKGKSSPYKGVYWDKGYEKWRAVITIDGKKRHIGRFSCEKQAALAYNDKAKTLHGEYARLNEVT